MKKIIFSLLGISFLVSGCGSTLKSMPGFAHTTALMVGETKEKIILQIEHVCGEPKEVAYMAKNTPDELETRRYNFTTKYDLVLYFHKDTFFQAGLLEPNSKRYPNYRPDYKEVTKGSSGPVGYIIVRKGNTRSIDILYENKK